MALLLQCLQELRLHQGESPLLQDSAATHGRSDDSRTPFVANTLMQRADTFTHRADQSCSVPFSNQRSTA
jgi:hypothetical protein